MLKVIAESSAELLDFIENLDTPLSEPQKRHVLQIADALITTEGRKDLSNLYRHIVGDPCAAGAALLPTVGALLRPPKAQVRCRHLP